MANEKAHPARGMTLLMDIAAKQSGLLTRRQLLDSGLSRNFIDRRIKSGLLRCLHAGVYQFGPVAVPYARERAALLACNGGVFSHRSAAGLWEVRPQNTTHPVDVVLCALPYRGVRPGIRVHRVLLGADEITTIHGLPITTVARTLLDVASISRHDLERALGVAERIEPKVRDQVAQLLTRYPNRRGCGILRTLLDDPASGTFTRSEAEEVLLALVSKAGLPKPEMNVMMHGYEVDFLWRAASLVVEVDGYAFHGSHHAFIRDRRRDSAMIAAGVRVLRLSWTQLTKERERTLTQLVQALMVQSPVVGSFTMPQT